jgi:hypothetical protein
MIASRFVARATFQFDDSGSKTSHSTQTLRGVLEHRVPTAAETAAAEAAAHTEVVAAAIALESSEVSRLSRKAGAGQNSRGPLLRSTTPSSSVHAGESGGLSNAEALRGGSSREAVARQHSRQQQQQQQQQQRHVVASNVVLAAACIVLAVPLMLSTITRAIRHGSSVATAVAIETAAMPADGSSGAGAADGAGGSESSRGGVSEKTGLVSGEHTAPGGGHGPARGPARCGS